MNRHSGRPQAQKLLSIISPDLAANDFKSLNFCGEEAQVLPSVFDLTGFASASVGAAYFFAAKLLEARAASSTPFDIEIDSLEAVAAFKSETLMKPLGWTIPAPWDAIAGDYKARDRWIRLHTNYTYHRDAVLRALALREADKATVAEKVKSLESAILEKKIIEEGGCAAVMYSRKEWEDLEVGSSTLNEPTVFLENLGSAKPEFGKIKETDLPLKEIRVLDLTRVIAGPECTKFLSSMGAEVLRIDPPGFDEVQALLPDTTLGKACAALDIKTPEGKAKFERLIKQAHVLVVGYRKAVLDSWGFSMDRLREINPSLILGMINAYGWNSKISQQRGFDSLVQMNTGIADLGAKRTRASKPIPMPVQALDHGAGFVLAAGICHGLERLFKFNQLSKVRTSLVGISNFLFSGPKGIIDLPSLSNAKFDKYLYEDQSPWGPLIRLQAPGKINGVRGCWPKPAGPLCNARAEFRTKG